MCNCSSSNCGCINSSVLPIGPSGTILTLGTFGSTPNTKGLTLTGSSTAKVLNLEPASALFPGGISTGTQTFAGEKTFNVFPEKLKISQFGIGIGATASDKLFINIIKTYTDPIAFGTRDTSLIQTVAFNYTGVSGDQSQSIATFNSAFVQGTNSTYALFGIYGRAGSAMDDSQVLDRVCSIHGSIQFTSNPTANREITDSIEFLGTTYNNENSGNNIIENSYGFYSQNPLNVTSGNTFNITNRFGFYCQDYGITPIDPIMSPTITYDTAVMTNIWQLYIDGTNLTTTSSYIGNRLGIGFNTSPTTHTSVTALLHLGRGSSETSKAPLKFTSGTNLTIPENGAVEYDGSNYFVTAAGIRHTLAKTLTATAVLDFPNTVTQTSSDLTITVTGAVLGDTVLIGTPNQLALTGSCFTGTVSAADTVTIRFNNYSAGALDPPSGTYRATVVKY